MKWSVEFLDGNIRKKIDALPKDIIASFLRIVALMELDGPQKVHEPYVKHLEGRVWEMRLRGKDGIARACYITASGKRVVVVHMFEKRPNRRRAARLNWP